MSQKVSALVVTDLHVTSNKRKTQSPIRQISHFRRHRKWLLQREGEYFLLLSFETKKICASDEEKSDGI